MPHKKGKGKRRGKTWRKVKFQKAMLNILPVICCCGKRGLFGLVGLRFVTEANKSQVMKHSRWGWGFPSHN